MPAPRGLVQWLDQYLHREAVLPREGRLLVAVSGGADSVALLRLLIEIGRSDHWKWELVVGHVDHGIRGEASRKDAEWVGSLSGRLGLRFESRELCLAKQLHAGAMGHVSEDRARFSRFQSLREMCAGLACDGVVFAHHADDQAETVLMKVFRGCGIGGLRAMQPQSLIPGRQGNPDLRIYRPLLWTRRSALRGYLEEVQQDWREDETNSSSAYLRNRVRQEVMPVLEKVWPSSVDALGRLTDIASGAWEVLEQAENELWEKALQGEVNRRLLEFSRQVLRGAPRALISQVLRRAIILIWGDDIADHGRMAEAVRLIRSLEGRKLIELQEGIRIELEGPWVRVSCHRDAPRPT